MPKNASRLSISDGLNACDERRFRNIVAAAVKTSANGDLKSKVDTVFFGNKAMAPGGIVDGISLVAVEMSRMPCCQREVNACAPSGESLFALP